MFCQDVFEVDFVEYDQRFLQASSIWLRDPDVKRLTLTPDFTDAQQERWFDSLRNKQNYRIWGIIAGDTPIGATGLKNIDHERSEGEYWGYLGEKAYWGCGIGRQMVQHVCDYAASLRLMRVYLRVAPENVRAISLYLKAGFDMVSDSDGVLLMQKALE